MESLGVYQIRISQLLESAQQSFIQVAVDDHPGKPGT